MRVAKDHVVSIRYIMKNSRGEILEDIMNNDPVNYLHGSPAILPLLQAQMEGLKTGDIKTVNLNASQGLTDEDFIFEVIVDEVREALPEEILLGYPVKINLAKCKSDCNCYDSPV